MKKSLVLWLVLSCTTSFSQNLYVEDFQDLVSGTSIDNGASGWTRDLRNATLGDPDDHFEVRVNNGLTLFQAVDVDGAPEWQSDVIDISGLARVQVFVDVAEAGDLENSDLIRLYYVLDGVRTQFAIFRNDFGSIFQTSSSPVLSGNTLQVVARIRNNADDELIAIDNVVVTGVGGTLFSRQTGNWNDPNSWSLTGFNGASCGCFPGRSSTAIIGDNHVITVSSDIDIQNLSIQNSGSLLWGGAFELDVFNNGVITIDEGGLLDVGTNTSAEFDLVETNANNDTLVVNGTFLGGRLDLNGSTSSLTISGSGTLEFESLILDGDDELLTNNLNGTLNIKGNVIIDGNTSRIVNNENIRIGGDLIYFNVEGEDIVNGTFTNNGSLSIDGDLLAAENSSLFINSANAILELNDIQTFFGTSFTLNNSGTIDLLGDISQTDANGIFNNLDGGIWNYAGTTPDPDIQLFADNPSNTFRYNGANQTIITPVDAYHSLTIGGNGIKSTASALDINGDLTFESTGVLDMNAGQNDLFLAGNWIESGDVDDPFVEGQRQVILDGAGSQSLEADTLFDVSVNKSAGDVVLNRPLAMINRLLINSATALETNDQLTLVSTSDGETGNGSIGTLGAGASIRGNVEVQRFMSGEGRIWRYLASPVTNTSVASWQDDFPITGAFDDPSSDAVGGIPIRPKSPSLYIYDEESPGGIQQGWVNYPRSGVAASNPVEVGTGYAAFVREASSSTTIEVIGPVYQGDFDFKVSFTDSGSPDDGWNLLGNPYPSPIDWAAPGWTKSGLADAVYIRDNGNATVATYVDGVGTNGGTGRIATGQAFWVQTIAPNPILSISEISKPSQGATFLRKAADESLMRITLSDGKQRDEAVFRFIKGATRSFEPQYDARKLENQTFNLSFQEADENLVIHSTSAFSCDDTLRLHLANAKPGPYQLDFSGVESFIPRYDITLLDAYDSTWFNVSDSLSYTFEVFDAASSEGSNRFLLLFAKRNDIAFDVTASRSCFGGNIELHIPDSKDFVTYSVYHKGDLLVQKNGNGKNLLFEIDPEKFTGQIVEFQVIGSAELCSVITQEKRISVEISSPDYIPRPLNSVSCGPGQIEFDFGHDEYRVRWYKDAGDISFLETNAYSTRFISETDSFYVSFVNDMGCESARSLVRVKIEELPQATLEPMGVNVLKTSYLGNKKWYFNNSLIAENLDQVVMEKPGTYSLKVQAGSCSDSISYTFETPLDTWFSSNQLYPNPVKDHVFIRLAYTGTSIYNIRDSKGIIHLTGRFEGQRGEVIRLDAKDLTAGYYFLQVNGERFRFLKL
ncbi:MAG: hypothetical protein AAF519_15530 [Bacteroidota bacterium]